MVLASAGIENTNKPKINIILKTQFLELIVLIDITSKIDSGLSPGRLFSYICFT